MPGLPERQMSDYMDPCKCGHDYKDHATENNDYECNVVGCPCSHYIADTSWTGGANVAATCPVIDAEGTVEHVFVATERACRCGKYLKRDLFRF